MQKSWCGFAVLSTLTISPRRIAELQHDLTRRGTTPITAPHLSLLQAENCHPIWARPAAPTRSRPMGIPRSPTPGAGLVPFTFTDARFAPISRHSNAAVWTPRPALTKASFTHRGLSGPAILQASSYWTEGATDPRKLLPDKRSWASCAARQSYAAATSRPNWKPTICPRAVIILRTSWTGRQTSPIDRTQSSPALDRRAVEYWTMKPLRAPKATGQPKSPLAGSTPDALSLQRGRPRPAPRSLILSRLGPWMLPVWQRL